MARVRWSSATIQEVPSAVGVRVRWGMAIMAGTSNLVINPIANIQAEPEVVVTLTATLPVGSSADSYIWRQISGPSIPISGTGSSISITTPSAMPPGATLVMGVTAVSGATQSAERTFNVNVFAQTEWLRVHGGDWTGASTSAN